MSTTFRGLSVIVTGASHGIGEAIALQLASQGARLVLAARREDELARVVAACRSRGGEAVVVPTNVTDPVACERLIAETVKSYGGVDVLINNAGLGMWARVDEVQDLSVFQRVMSVNYLGSVYCTVAALPHLKARQGRIVCVSSLAGRTGVPMRSGYAASKHAMQGFFDSLRIELAGSGVTVTMVHPGFVSTGAQGRNLGGAGTALGQMPVALPGAMSAEACARLTVAAAADRKRELVMTGRGRLGLWLKLLVPGFVDRMAAKAIATGR